MADKGTVVQNAQRYMAKGQIDKAINEWQKLISESPNDGNIFNTIGDLLLKKHDISKGVEAYLKGAEVFHSAGFALKTIAIYKKLIKLVPKRLDILVRLANLNAERGLVGNAIEDYLSAAKQYIQDGNVRECLEVYRKIANLDPSNTGIRLKIADLCLKEGLEKDAIDEYLKVAESYRNNNQIREAEDLYDRVLKLDPKNEAARNQKGQPVQAQPAPSQEAPSQPSPVTREQILSQVDDFIKNDKFDDARNLLGPFMEQNPDDPVGYHRLGTILLKAGNKDDGFDQFRKAALQYLTRSEYGEASNLMKDFIEADPERTDAHLLLAEAYDRGGDPQQAISTYAHVIDDSLASGETTRAKELYAKIKGLDPQHRDVRRLRHSFEISESSQPQITPVETVALSEGSAPPVSDEAVETAVMPSAPEAGAPSLEPEPIIDPVAIQSLLTEAEVYLKYGLSTKAIEQLQQILAMDPENESAHLQLKDLYKNEGPTEKAVDECFRLIEIYKKMGDSERGMALLEEAKGLDPANPRIREATDLSPIMDSGRMKAILADETAHDEAPAPPPETATPASSAASRDAVQSDIPTPSHHPQDQMAEQMAEADFYQQQGLRDEARKMYETILEVEPNFSSAKNKLDAIAAEETLEIEKKAKEEKIVQEARPVPESPPPIKPEIPPTPPKAEASKPAPVKSSDESRLDEELDKSFAPFMSPEKHETVEEPVAMAASEKSPPEEVEQSLKADDKKDEYVDITGILNDKVKVKNKGNLSGDLSDEKTVNEQLDSIFEEFQKDVVQVDDIDYETHYNLGIAYKEMGLLNEAMTEFKQSMNGPDRFIDSCNMLAACEQEEGNHSEAIKLLERALSDPRCEEAQGRWLRYDLASLYEKESRTEDALNMFSMIAESDRKFKDVIQRIESLKQAAGKTPRKTPAAAPSHEEEDEDLDVMMDRMFGESSPATQSRRGRAEDTDGSKQDARKKDRISYL